MSDEESRKPGYTSADLKHLSDRDHVRERFGMYIGDNTARGLHHLVYEVVDNSIDECMAGYARQVSVTVNVDGSVTVEDDGRGIPVDIHPQLSEEMDREVSTLENWGSGTRTLMIAVRPSRMSSPVGTRLSLSDL
ncbi:MAG: hypothetical protein EBX35_03025 [Planctomycetia bacterium]|nr:hypothetical protein [Planctomycetia bacterium]